MDGVNLLQREGPKSALLDKWYSGSTLVDALGMLQSAARPRYSVSLLTLDTLEPPARNISAPLRLPISNVFKGQGAGIAVSGRICGGVIQVGERLRILPGDEFGVIKCEFVLCVSIPVFSNGS